MSDLYKHDYLYIISNLNEFSLLLAESIKNESPGSEIIFAGGAPESALLKRAADLNCRLREESAERIDTGFASDQRLRFVLMDSDESRNLNAALSLTARLRDKANAEIYTFNTTLESECLLDGIYKGGYHGNISPVRIRRVNAVRNQIYTDLFNNSIFDDAVEIYNEMVISVLIVGLGKCGTEMLKALLWCAQMDGYVLRVHVIDRSPNTESVFFNHCPGIKQRGAQPKNGEDYYELYFHSGIDVHTYEFRSIVRELPETTLAFIALGSEDINLEISLMLRSLFSGIIIDRGMTPDHSRSTKQRPRIVTVINSPEKASLIRSNTLSNYKKQYYQIDCIGSFADLYSYKNIFAPELEAMALQSHLQLGTEEDFNNYEYNRRSSMASAIHKKYRDQLISDPEARAVLEHKRWNAYMRGTEGYSFGYIRDDLARRHPLLVKYDNLSRIEKEKDKKINLAPSPKANLP